MSTSSSPFYTFPPSSSASPPYPSKTSFTLSPPYNTPTDIWRKAANPVTGEEVSTFNAPIIYKKVDVRKFKRVRVTTKGEWRRKYDQGGLVLVFPGEESHSDKIHESSLKWIKAGIEYYQSRPWLGHVACDNFADWSLTTTGITADQSVTIEMERDPKEGTLWLYSIDEKGERFPIREVTWAFSKERLDRGGEIWVGVYAATPILEGRKTVFDALRVRFEGWELEVGE